MVRSFGVHGSFPCVFLVEHDFAEGVERGRKGARAWDSSVEVGSAPRSYRGMDIAVGGAKVEFFLDDWRQFRAVFDCVLGFGGVASCPGVHEIAFRVS